MSASLWDQVPQPWREPLASVREAVANLDDLISSEIASGFEVVPNYESIFASLEVDPKNVRLVILGQDPYPNIKHAIGLAFATPTDTKPLPGSLRNIFKEIASDTGANSQADESLKSWIAQGVLLLNTALTTRHGQSGAHANWTWSLVTDQILQTVTSNNPKVVALLWGKSAQEYAHLFQPQLAISSAHPSPLSASRGFLGSKPFTKANDLLLAQGGKPIAW